MAVGGGARASVAGVGGRGTGPRDGANFATCVVFLLLTRTKRRGVAFFEGCPVGWDKKAVPKRSKSREGVREGLAWRSGGVQGLRLRGGRW